MEEHVKFLDEALEGVESGSIREWANSDHNRPILEEMAKGALDKAAAGGGAADVHLFSAYVVSLAIGL